MRTALWMVACCIGFCVFGCGGGGGSPTPVTVNVLPASQGIPINGSQQFAATIANNPGAAFSWKVQEGAAGGAISATGLYQAPATAGVYHVVATGGGGSGTATITVHPIVTVSPANPKVLAGAGNSQTFTASVAGTTNQSVRWQVQETGGGSINTSGVYSPPNTPGVYHVAATSAADTAAVGSTSVTVQGGNIQGTIQ